MKMKQEIREMYEFDKEHPGSAPKDFVEGVLAGYDWLLAKERTDKEAHGALFVILPEFIGHNREWLRGFRMILRWSLGGSKDDINSQKRIN